MEHADCKCCTQEERERAKEGQVQCYSIALTLLSSNKAFHLDSADLMPGEDGDSEFSERGWEM